MSKKYVLGLDYGSLSGRALLVEADTGREVATSVFPYPHGFIEETLPATGEKLPPNWTVQDPQDYLDVLANTIPDVMRQAGVSADDIIGVGVDFTACTVLPVKMDGTPLCFLPEFKSNKHAYVKKWKHHAAQEHANRLNAIAAERGEPWLKKYGGKISSEWLFPKLWQILDEAPEVYNAMDRFMEATDWIVMQLTGVMTRANCTAGYKAMWTKGEGYPSKAFFKALDPRLENVIEEKIGEDIAYLGEKAGCVTEDASKLTGLMPGTAVAVGNVDAHVSVPAVGITGEGAMLMIMGTSTCDMILGKAPREVPGMCGVVEDGILSGLYGFEAGQSCVGDHFQWFVENCVPGSYYDEAAARKISIHQLLREKVQDRLPGASGLLALDWWNGNRSVLVDTDLTGLMVGMTLLTKPEEIYRALIEATAYGAREIIETFEKNGVPIREVYACGGIAAKDAFMMQIYADVFNREIKISASDQTCALGSALFGAVAAGKAAGGYDTVAEASQVMAHIRPKTFVPNPDNVKLYDRIFAEYRLLHDYFGRGANDVMKRLNALKRELAQ